MKGDAVAEPSPQDEEPTGPRHPLAWSYGLLGVALAAGAPVGALGLRLLFGVRDPIAELRSHAFFYLYQLVGTSLVFGATGVMAGLRVERLRRGRDRYRSLAEHDALTEISNVRAFQARYRRALERAARFREPISLLLLDVDRLKELNDRFGHSCGTAALVHVARTLAACKREDDLAARWGGDEFVLLMPGADAASARRQADAILERLRENPLRHGGLEHVVSVTIGVATSVPPSAEENLFDRADAALYEGKREGRGRVREAAG
jgi:diguanylate cyclase (GGDEF)-like protein